MLTIAIVGGGIAGLSAAIGLRRAGHLVHIYERSTFSNEVGAAIQAASNASRVLLAWGFDPIRAKAVTAKQHMRADGQTLEVLARAELSDFIEKFGGPWYLLHRVDLHSELKRLATTEGYGIPAVIHLGAEVVAYSPLEPHIRLRDGTVVSADVVITADGIHSMALEAITGASNPPHQRQGYNFCYRFLISTDELEVDPDTRFWNKNSDACIRVFTAPDKRIVSYPCRNQDEHNFVALFHHEDPDSMNMEDWQASVDVSHVLQRFADFDPRLLAVVSKAKDVKQWPLLYRPPIESWVKGRVALAGDAAHPMLPFQGQGGGQAIEDGVALGIVLSGAKPANVPERLAAYESIRRLRASVMQACSNAGQDEAHLVQQEAAKYMPADQIPKSPAEFQRFNLGYDVIEDSMRYMRRQDPGFCLSPCFFENTPNRGLYP